MTGDQQQQQQQQQQTPWYAGAGFDDLPEANRGELTGYLQNRGWDKSDARTAALGAIKAHREAEKLIGVPAEKVIRLPKDASDVAGWQEVRTKLGVPADAKGYDFSAVKQKDGSALDENFTATLSAALLEANVPKDRAPTVAQAVLKYLEEGQSVDAGEAAAKLALEKDTLTSNWGNKYNANLIVAQNAAKTLGVTPEQIAALEKTIGYAAVMEMFRNIGARTGEDQFVTGNGPAGGPMTREQAAATMKERIADKVWTEKLEAGDTATKREFDNLTRMMQPR